MYRFTVDYFIKKFEAIPEEQWCTGTFSELDGKIEQHCALGHCGVGVQTDETEESSCLQQLFINHLNFGASYINDQTVFQGKTPKQRILNALKTIKQRELRCYK